MMNKMVFGKEKLPCKKIHETPRSEEKKILAS